MRAETAAAIEAVTGARAVRVERLAGGCVGDVYKVLLSDGETVAAKAGGAGSGLRMEGFMLRYLAGHSALPVPAVLHEDDSLLLMSYLDGGGGLNAGAQRHAADLVAALHGVTADRFGFPCDTVIGGLAQPNPWSGSWRTFFRDQRLMAMGNDARRAGRLPGAMMTRLEKFCAKLDRWIGEPAAPSLIHGDMWSGNVLAKDGGIAGFIDPAIYYADAEIELAFTTLFGTFSDAFFDRYQDHRPIAPGFFEERRDIYTLYPLLVHVRLFGGSYVGSVDRTLSRFGF